MFSLGVNGAKLCGSTIVELCGLFFLILLMVQKSQTTTWDVFEPPMNNGINYQPQLVSLPDFFQPSTSTTERCGVFFLHWPFQAGRNTKVISAKVEGCFLPSCRRRGIFWGPKPQKTTSFQTGINSRPVAEQSRNFGSATRVWFCCFPCFPCFLQVLHSKPTSSFRLLPNPASKDVDVCVS